MSTSAKPETPANNSSAHEFDSQQSRVIGDLARSMHWVAAPLILVGVLYAVAAVMGIVQAFKRPEALVSVVFVVLSMLFFIALGAWTRRAADSFKRITSTSGQDISHLMDALENLRKKYSLLSVIVKIYVALMILSLVFMLIAIILGAFKT